MKPCKHSTLISGCRICWLYERDPRYRQLWGGPPIKLSCVHLGVDTGQQVSCAESCRGTKLKVFQCAVYGVTTIFKRGDGIGACCRGCPRFEAENAGHRSLKEAARKMTETAQMPLPPTNGRALTWSYGVTTVPKRLADGTLLRTISSLSAAGFDSPRLFVDGDTQGSNWLTLDLPITYRYPAVRTFGNWVMGMWELYLREPHADRYAMFQDDLITYPNLRAYLDQSPYPDDGYLNLYTMPSNQSIAPPGLSGWYRALFLECTKCNQPRRKTNVQQTGMCCGERQFQYGRGAVALVFTRKALQALLSSEHMVQRPTDPLRGHRAIDGGISWSMNKLGFYEYVHNPSLVQHVGEVSTMGNAPHPLALSFKGEKWDALQMVATTT